jgi:hypothetical protein
MDNRNSNMEYCIALRNCSNQNEASIIAKVLILTGVKW